MSYMEIQPAFYEMLQPDTAWHAGARGWTQAPWVTWGNNPNLVGLPRLGVGQEPGQVSLLPLAFGVLGIGAVLAVAAYAVGKNQKPMRRNALHKQGPRRRRARKAA